MLKIRASLLIECALGLISVGLFLSISLVFWRATNYEKNRYITEQRCHNVQVALQGYVMRYGFLPMAADSESGQSSRYCVSGYVPYKTLGLSKDHLRDGNGRLFKFIVNENLTLEYQINRGKRIVPIFLPTTYVYNDNTVSWNRLYEFKEPYVVFDYDDFDEAKNIKLFKNNKRLSLDVVECDRPILPNLLYTPENDADIIAEFHESKKKYKVYDLVAWAVVPDNGHVDPLNLELNAKIYYQTRFNLAACVKHSCDANGAYLSHVDNLTFRLKE